MYIYIYIFFFIYLFFVCIQNKHIVLDEAKEPCKMRLQSTLKDHEIDRALGVAVVAFKKPAPETLNPKPQTPNPKP